MPAINLFKRIGNHASVTKQLIEVAIKADDLATATVIVPPAVRKGRGDLRSLRNDLVALGNGDDVVITPNDPRLIVLDAAMAFFNL